MASPTSNYQFLWNLTNANGADPDPSSFFNIQTIKTFCDLGERVPNIIKNPSLIYGVDFTLESGWQDLTTVMGLAD